MQQCVSAEGRMLHPNSHGLSQAGVNRQHSLQTGSSFQAAPPPQHPSPPPRALTRPLTLSGARFSDIHCSARSSNCQARMLMVPTRWFSADLWAKLRVSHAQQQHLLDLNAPLELQNLTLYSPFFLSLQQSVSLNLESERNSAPADLSSSCSQWFFSCSSSFTGNSTEPRTYICREEQVRRGRGWRTPPPCGRPYRAQ